MTNYYFNTCIATIQSHKRIGLYILLPLSIILIIFIPQLHNAFSLIPCVFTVATIFVVNFPDLAPSLHKRPIYLGDITIDENEIVASNAVAARHRKHQFYKYFYILVNFLFILLITGCCDYTYYIITVKQHPDSYIEIAGVIGGILSLWGRVQQLVGRTLLYFCYNLHKWKEDSHRRNEIITQLIGVIPPPIIITPQNINNQAEHNNAGDFLGV